MLALLRIVVIFFFFIFINLILILVCFVRPFHRDNVYLAGKLYSSISFLLGLKIKVRTPDSVISGGPYVFMANHQNSYDLITICAAVVKGTVSVGKKSLVWIPLFGQVYWLSGNILIDRKNAGNSRSTLQKTVQKIRQKRLSVWFFPEGTRSYGRGLLPFKTGAFRIAEATKAPIVLVSASELHNKIALNRWSNGTLIVEMSAPERMDENKTLKQNVEYFQQKMGDTISKLNTELAENSKAKSSQSGQ
ncbi:1-acylglycerol-3-phosphate O-acyltransferase [Paraglaciecola aquimarina]|uniref:1-acyl-sn-glycerol-3-phosphate acyltransferase n=1 Tax=Paraglaciecola aquimarina TaxID=1235557 RepID=A0ABU3SW78_9ALTE|nr:1-acylglycerol-3-phosphate O-acyltransferase [Paraglaciecola aquimarina]MDU0354259.1 1-acylglycerol-3-phosphate O-acyltransferase [Paraglaciecola aquimarina]